MYCALIAAPIAVLDRMPAAIIAPISPKSAADAPTLRRGLKYVLARNPSDVRDEVQHEKSRCAIGFFYLRADAEQHPRVHEDVNQAAVQESGGHQTPPLSRGESPARTSRRTRPALVHRHPSTASSAPCFMLTTTVAAIEPKVDQQDHERRESGVRDESGDQIGRLRAVRRLSVRASFRSTGTPGRLR